MSEITHLLPSTPLRNALAPSKFALALSNVHNSMAPNPDFNDSPRLRSSNGPMSPESMQLTEDVTDEQLDRVVDRALRTGDVPRLIKAYKPDARWLWGRWRHTVLEQTWTPALVAMSVALAVHFTVKGGAAWLRVFASTGEIDLGPGDPEHNVVKQLKTLDTMWTYLLTMTTFVNSFFLSQAYGLWLATKVNSRKIQGRLNDVLMLLATHAARDGDGRYLPAAETLLADVARNVRTFHVFFWVGMTGKNTRQDRVKGMAPLALLRHDRGLKALRRRGALTERELETLLGPGGPSAKGRYHVVLEWIVTRCVDAKRRGLLVGGAGMETVLLDKCCLLRATCASIGDDMDARMPLACAAAQFCAILARNSARNSLTTRSVGPSQVRPPRPDPRRLAPRPRAARALPAARPPRRAARRDGDRLLPRLPRALEVVPRPVRQRRLAVGEPAGRLPRHRDQQRQRALDERRAQAAVRRGEVERRRGGREWSCVNRKLYWTD